MKISISPKWDVDLQFHSSQKDINTFQTDSIHVVVYGYPYFCSEDKWYTAEDAFKHYQTNNEQFIHEIDGIYSILIIDHSSKTCKIITDRYGIYTFYYGYVESGNFIISDNLQEFANELSEIEIETKSVIEYLNYGIKLGAKTHLHKVKKFEGATNYLINNKLEIKRERYWELLDIKDIAKVDDNKFLEIFNKHFEKACALEEKISIPLTGGKRFKGNFVGMP
jgi:asparagine synthetase B (glutamine-hydrolysing)